MTGRERGSSYPSISIRSWKVDQIYATLDTTTKRFMLVKIILKQYVDVTFSLNTRKLLKILRSVALLSY